VRWKGGDVLTVNAELVALVEKFAESGWDLIGEPAEAWLAAYSSGRDLNAAAEVLVKAVEQADVECGSCGCEFDPLYKQFLAMAKQ